MPLTHKISRSTWYLLVILYVSMFAAVSVAIFYTQHAVRTTEKKFCTIVVLSDEAYRQPPPRTFTPDQIKARQQAAETMHKLREDLKC
jgi:hypothetical protein